MFPISLLQLKLTAPQRNKATTKTKLSHAKLGSTNYTSPGERKFLQEANTMLNRELPTHDTPSPGDSSAKFDESWPTSERPSTIESPSEYSSGQIFKKKKKKKLDRNS